MLFTTVNFAETLLLFITGSVVNVYLPLRLLLAERVALVFSSWATFEPDVVLIPFKAELIVKSPLIVALPVTSTPLAVTLSVSVLFI